VSIEYIAADHVGSRLMGLNKERIIRHSMVFEDSVGMGPVESFFAEHCWSSQEADSLFISRGTGIFQHQTGYVSTYADKG